MRPEASTDTAISGVVQRGEFVPAFVTVSEFVPAFVIVSGDVMIWKVNEFCFLKNIFLLLFFTRLLLLRLLLELLFYY